MSARCDHPPGWLSRTPSGWHWFGIEYRMPDGSRWQAHVMAQSVEDAETRLRCIGESGSISGRVVQQLDGGGS